MNPKKEGINERNLFKKSIGDSVVITQRESIVNIDLSGEGAHIDRLRTHDCR